MKTTIKTGIAFLLLTAVACTKENINSPASSLQSSEQSNETTAFHIGQHYHGGIIFYIDNTSQHGLIASTADQGSVDSGTNVSWNNGTNIVTGATGTAVGTGASNTNAIIAAQGSAGNYAATLCENYKVGKYQDWYLPSRDELNLLYKKQSTVGGFTGGNYWSSSEFNKGKAWDQEFGGGFKFKDAKNFTLNVRAISSF